MYKKGNINITESKAATSSGDKSSRIFSIITSHRKISEEPSSLPTRAK